MAKVILVRAGRVHLEGAEHVRVVLSDGRIHPIKSAESVAVETLSVGRIVDMNMHTLSLESRPKSKL